MRAELTVARELVRCRLMESGRDALLERVAELLDAAASGAPPFCHQLPPQATTGSHGGPRRDHAPSGVPGGFVNTSTAGGAGGSAAPIPRRNKHEHKRRLPWPKWDAALSSSKTPRWAGATWSVGHYGEVFGVTAPEA